MPYNQELDECLFNKGVENDSGRISVCVYSYNKGAKKLQISRENRDMEGNLRFAKLGRLTKEELTAILPLMQEAANHME